MLVTTITVSHKSFGNENPPHFMKAVAARRHVYSLVVVRKPRESLDKIKPPIISFHLSTVKGQSFANNNRDEYSR